MPTYTVTCVEGTLDAPKRAKIASEITRIHSETTGAPAYFAQVISRRSHQIATSSAGAH